MKKTPSVLVRQQWLMSYTGTQYLSYILPQDYWRHVDEENSDNLYLFTQIQNEKYHGGTDCSFMDMDFVKEKAYMPMNETAVHNILSTGGRYSQLRQFSAGVNMNCTSNNFLKAHEKAIDDAALQSMQDAAEEEKSIAIRDGNGDSDGVPMCTVVADGAWCKHSYRTNYDSLSGVVSIVGLKTGKVLYIGVRNRYCSICASCQNAKQTPPATRVSLTAKKCD
ncbi:hypothetical protein PR048_020873 [Dryococelus australis]|uniref:Mutator-like transposase domain-containing protein n=1 Tax=Dryococelus australis TaxID=614101 RepID=A0ABQ9GWP8_9NEOP|nr:hypothetical protein PR048_020873 [Dryococelus australis]